MIFNAPEFFFSVLITCFCPYDTHFSENPGRPFVETRVRGVDRAIHSMELDSRVDAFFARPSRSTQFRADRKSGEPDYFGVEIPPLDGETIVDDVSR